MKTAKQYGRKKKESGYGYNKTGTIRSAANNKFDND